MLLLLLILYIHFSPGYLQCIDSATVSLVQKYSLQIQTLSYSQAVIPVTATQPGPDGCAVAIASDRCTVNLMLKVSAGMKSSLDYNYDHTARM